MNNYYIVITPEIQANSNLNEFEKLLFGKITALTKKEGYCYATNKRLAGTKSERTVSRAIAKLSSLKLVRTEYIEDSLGRPMRRIRVDNIAELDLPVQGAPTAAVKLFASIDNNGDTDSQNCLTPAPILSRVVDNNVHTPRQNWRDYNKVEKEIKEINNKLSGKPTEERGAGSLLRLKGLISQNFKHNSRDLKNAVYLWWRDKQHDPTAWKAFCELVKLKIGEYGETAVAKTILTSLSTPGWKLVQWSLLEQNHKKQEAVGGKNLIYDNVI